LDIWAIDLEPVVEPSEGIFYAETAVSKLLFASTIFRSIIGGRIAPKNMLSLCDLAHLTLNAKEVSRKNTSVSLRDHYTEFVDAQAQADRYGSASEALRAGLRLLKEREIRLRALQAALSAGEESGPPAVFDSEDFLKRMRDKHVR
jgi:antitoxin ParD1/3/4